MFTWFYGTERDVNQHSSISESSPAAYRGIILTHSIHTHHHWRFRHIGDKLRAPIPNTRTHMLVSIAYDKSQVFGKNWFEIIFTYHTLTM